MSRGFGVSGRTLACGTGISAFTFLCSRSRCSSALSQPGDVQAKTDTDPDTPSAERRDSAAGEREADEVDEAAPGMELSGASSANDMLCTSQTLDDEPLTPEVVTPPKAVVTSQ